MNDQLGREQVSQRVWHLSVSFSEVAPEANIKQVVVVRAKFRTKGHGKKVIEGKFPQHSPPGLSPQAENATETKLVPKPGAITGVVRIPHRSMTPGMR
jgi:hypothetical protein